MQLDIIEIVVFSHEGNWKVYREEELVAVYPNTLSAETAARGFTRELQGRGKPVNLRILLAEEAVAFIAHFVDGGV